MGNGILHCIGEAGFKYLEMPEWGVREAVGCVGLSSGVIPGPEQCRGGIITIRLGSSQNNMSRGSGMGGSPTAGVREEVAAMMGRGPTREE